MKFNTLAILVIIIFTFLATGCISEKTNIPAKPETGAPHNAGALYDMYVELSGNVRYIQIRSIQPGQIDYTHLKDFPFKARSRTITNLVEGSEGMVYAAVDSPSNPQFSNIIIPIRHGVEKQELELKTYNPSIVIADQERNKAYVFGGPSTSNILPDGSPVSVIDMAKTEELDVSFHIKGVVGGYDIQGDYIYVVVFGAHRSQYTDVPDQYLMRIHRDTQETEVITKSGVNLVGSDLKIAKNGRLYVAGFIPQSDGKLIHQISVYEQNGTHVKDIPLRYWASKMAVDNNGIAYILNRDKNSSWDQLGETITVLDMKKDEIIEVLEGFKGPTDLQMKDSYLFVTNNQSGTVTVMNTNTRAKVGDIVLGDRLYPFNLVVIKNVQDGVKK